MGRKPHELVAEVPYVKTRTGELLLGHGEDGGVS